MNFPYQGLAPDIAVEVAVVAYHDRPEFVAVVQGVPVGRLVVEVQQEDAVVLDPDDPGRIASHSSMAAGLAALVAFAGWKVPAAGVAVFLVLRFPLFHRTALRRFSFDEHQAAKC